MQCAMQQNLLIIKSLGETVPPKVQEGEHTPFSQGLCH